MAWRDFRLLSETVPSCLAYPSPLRNAFPNLEYKVLNPAPFHGWASHPRVFPSLQDGVSYTDFYCYEKDHDQTELGEEGVYFISHVPVTVHHEGQSGEELGDLPGGRN